MVRDAVQEYESRQTPEAQCARDADKLEMLLQAVEYRDIGVHRVDGWIDSARKSLTTMTSQRIAEAAITLSPLVWRNRRWPTASRTGLVTDRVLRTADQQSPLWPVGRTPTRIRLEASQRPWARRAPCRRACSSR